MSLIEAIPEQLRHPLLVELKEWAGEDANSCTKEVLEQRRNEKEAEMQRIQYCLENNLPLTADNLSVGIENLQEDADSGVMVSLNENEQLKQS